MKRSKLFILHTYAFRHEPPKSPALRDGRQIKIAATNFRLSDSCGEAGIPAGRVSRRRAFQMAQMASSLQPIGIQHRLASTPRRTVVRRALCLWMLHQLYEATIGGVSNRGQVDRFGGSPPR